jgi:hypothetical protein
MKYNLPNFLFILLLGNVGYFGAPWWALAVVAAIGALLFQGGNNHKNIPATPAWQLCLSAFAAGMVLWYATALMINSANGGLLASRVGALFNGLSASGLMWITGLLGGITAALGALFGTQLAQLFVRRKRKRYKFD